MSHLDLCGVSSHSTFLHEQVRKFAPTPFPLLIQGETGTGKSCLAGLIHSRSARSGAFVTIESVRALLEARGWALGSYTGSRKERPGLLEQAHQGTVLVEGVDEFDPGAQAYLAGIMSRPVVRRSGGARWRKVDLRWMATSQSDLRSRVLEGSFREDLYHRLSVAIFDLEPLRKSPVDLFRALKRCLPKSHSLSPKALRALLCHTWPGNWREFEHCLKALVVAVAGGTIDECAVKSVLAIDEPSATSRDRYQAFLEKQSAEHRRFLEAVLRQCRGRQKLAAEVLGLDRHSFGRLLRKLRKKVQIS